MSLAASLRKYEDPQSDADRAWRRFVIDHQDELIASATRATIAPDVMTMVTYDPERYLRIVHLPGTPVWIFRLINRLPNDREFVDRTSALLPDPADINALYRAYQVTTSSR